MPLPPIPLLSTMVALPALGAGVLAGTRRPGRARGLAVGVAVLTLALSTGVLLLFHSGESGLQLAESWGRVPLLGMGYRLGVDGVSVLALPLTTLLTLSLVAAGPRRALDPSMLQAMLLTESATLGLLCAQDLALLLAFWVATLLPAHVLITREARTTSERRTLRTFHTYLLGGGTLPLLAAVVLLAVPGWRARSETPFGLAELLGHGVPPSWQGVIFVLLMLAVLIRMAVAPFHSWLPVLLARGPFGVGLLLVNVQVGLYLLVRVVLPLLPAAWAAGTPLLSAVSLFSALYGSVLALAQVDLRRTMGFLLVSQSGLVLAGLAAMSFQGVAGALLLSVAAGMTLTGLMLVIWALEARTGTADMTRLGGLVRRGPRMAALFFLLGFGSLGFPGTLSFVGEDLLLHGLGIHPLVVLPTLLAAGLNAITFLRAFQRTFLGAPTRAHAPMLDAVEDLLPRERVTALSLCALLFLGGLIPAPLLRLREQEVAALVGHRAMRPQAGQGR